MSESEPKPTTRQVILTGDFEKAFQQLNPADQTLLGQYTGMFGFDQLEIEEIAANLNTTSAQVEERVLETVNRLRSTVKITEVTITAEDAAWSQKVAEDILSLD